MNEQPNNSEQNDQSKTPIKKSKSKIILIIIAVILTGAGAYAGIAVTKKSDQVSGQTDRGQATSENTETNRARQRPAGGFQFQGVTTTAQALLVDEYVLVVGTANSDGSLTADSIQLGEFSNDDFQGFLNRGQNSEIVDGNEDAPIGENQRPQGGGFGQSDDFTGEEERQQRFQELRDSGQILEGFGGGRGSGGGFTGRVEGTEIIRGEIIDKDDISITVKLTDGGSRLIFFSDATLIFKENSENSRLEGDGVPATQESEAN